MIEYDKIKLASTLACNKDMNLSIKEYSLRRNNTSHEWSFNNIDEMITVLRHATKSTLKYNIGDEVWFINDFNEITQDKIIDIDDASEEKYLINDIELWFKEEDLYASRIELIDAQIKYWTLKKINKTKKSVEDNECEHVADVEIHIIDDQLIRFKCKKCKIYYK
jgi:hypothetical protein